MAALKGHGGLLPRTRMTALIVVGAIAGCSHSQDIDGCGGFVSIAPEISGGAAAKGLDLSRVKVQLMTLEGMVKYEEACAPNGCAFHSETSSPECLL
jgi:hypothetical protein